MLRDLIKLANHLDSRGLTKEADFVDNIVKKSFMMPTSILDNTTTFVLAELPLYPFSEDAIQDIKKGFLSLENEGFGMVRFIKSEDKLKDYFISKSELKNICEKNNVKFALALSKAKFLNILYLYDLENDSLLEETEMDLALAAQKLATEFFKDIEVFNPNK